ncbi:MAG: hypothetical protein AB4060_04315 [Crocosphaera sp.]
MGTGYVLTALSKYEDRWVEPMSRNFLIKNLICENNSLKIQANDDFRAKYLTDDFIVEYCNDVKVNDLDYTFLTIPFILNVIPIVWLSGNEYYIESMDAQLSESLKKIHNSFQVMYPNVDWTGKLIAENYLDSKSSVTHDCTGVLFTGGVDSTFTSLESSEENQLLITVFSLKNVIKNKIGCLNLQKKLLSYGQERGYSNTFIKSNFRDFLKTQYLGSIVPDISIWWGQVQCDLGLAGLLTPLLINKNCGKLLIPAGEAKKNWGSHPSISNNIYWTGFSAKLNGYEYSRHEKIQRIIEMRIQRNLENLTLRVCDYIEDQKDAANCCKCGKCLRTMTALLIEGENIEDYGFNISTAKAIEQIKLGYTKDIRSDGRFSIWQSLQARAKEILSSEMNDNTRKIKSFLSWLEAADIDGYYSQHKNKHKFRQFIKVTFSKTPAIYRKLYELDQFFAKLLK